MRHALGCENALSDFSTGQDLLAEPQGSALVVESWSQRAVRHGDAIYVFDKFGNATALDLHYRPLPQQAPMRRRPHCMGSADPLPQPLTSRIDPM
jgi:membrane-anchored protein YejM (alkaline phosphatase superfamily)